MLKILRLVPNLDPKVFLESVQSEKAFRADKRPVTLALEEEAMQHIEIAKTYIDLGLVDSE